MNEEAVNLTPDNHPDKPARLNNFGTSLYRRFERLGDVADIDKSISIIEEAVRLSPDNYVDKPTLLDNLKSSLCYRFQLFHNPADIKISILMLEEAVRLTIDGLGTFRDSSDLRAVIVPGQSCASTSFSLVSPSSDLHLAQGPLVEQTTIDRHTLSHGQHVRAANLYLRAMRMKNHECWGGVTGSKRFAHVEQEEGRYHEVQATGYGSHSPPS